MVWFSALLASLGAAACPSPTGEVRQPQIRIVLTFDDGPANPTLFGSPTERVLDILATEKISAAFFVLTTPDRFVFRRIPKGDTDAGFAILQRAHAEGHVVGIHAGGRYDSQWRLHPTRLLRAAYDIDGDERPDFVTHETALESDLLEARSRVESAARAAGIDGSVAYVRPPFMVYKLAALDARPTYKALGLKLVLADGSFRDTGYAIHPMSNALGLRMAINRSLRSGETSIILALHDSNHWTAIKLPSVIRSIRRHFRAKGMVEGRDWCFTRSREEVQEAIDGRIW